MYQQSTDTNITSKLTDHHSLRTYTRGLAETKTHRKCERLLIYSKKLNKASAKVDVGRQGFAKIKGWRAFWTLTEGCGFTRVSASTVRVVIGTTLNSCFTVRMRVRAMTLCCPQPTVCRKEAETPGSRCTTARTAAIANSRDSSTWSILSGQFCDCGCASHVQSPKQDTYRANRPMHTGGTGLEAKIQMGSNDWRKCIAVVPVRHQGLN